MKEIDEYISKIKEEIEQIRKEKPRLRDDSAFVLWFLTAYLADSEEEALNSLTGEKGDKGIDAILFDHENKKIYVVQGKFHRKPGIKEKRNDVLAFAEIGTIPWKDRNLIDNFILKLAPADKFEELIKCVMQKNYSLHLYYVTTGICSETLRREAKAWARQAGGQLEISIFDMKQLITIYKDYLEGVAPAVPSLELRIASENGIHSEGIIHRYDPRTKIEAWVFSMPARDVGEMFKYGIRLFARNIRGYLGSSNEINKAMEKTINEEPHNFWYYNNGITIVCDEAKLETRGGQNVLIVERPQIINGQQTTRTLNKNPSTDASVIVRVIKIPRTEGQEIEYKQLVSSIVRATNWQNAIKPSDLVSNDHVQVWLERQLRKKRYLYLRKRQTKQEIRRIFGSSGYFLIKKEELAKAVASCQLDPVVVREGVEGLFDERHYSIIFKVLPVSFYLSRYWLMRQVNKVSRGYPERGYAKWVVLHFAWKKIRHIIDNEDLGKRFQYACENEDNAVLKHLRKALNDIFNAVLKFYRVKRGRGKKALDVSTFFKRSGLHNEFDTFWNSSKNGYKNKAETNLDRFKNYLDKVELPTK